MGLVRKFRAMIGSDLAGEPSDGKSTSWQLPYETLRKRWNAVPTTHAEFESTTKLIDLPRRSRTLSGNLDLQREVLAFQDARLFEHFRDRPLNLLETAIRMKNRL